MHLDLRLLLVNLSPRGDPLLASTPLTLTYLSSILLLLYRPCLYDRLVHEIRAFRR